jgi:ubiquitin carboxyl-terminal hydrolase 7
MNQQHDVNEFFLVLSDKLEKQMQGTRVSGTYARLFEGEFENVIQCLNVEYESSRKEKFNCIQLSLPDNHTDPITIEDSFRKYVESEDLAQDNQYDAEGFGK